MPPSFPTRRSSDLAASIALLLAAGTAGWVAWEQVAPDHDSLVALTRHASEASLQSAGDANSGAVPAAQRPAVGEHQVVAWLAAQPGNVPATVTVLESLGFRLVGQDRQSTRLNPRHSCAPRIPS